MVNTIENKTLGFLKEDDLDFMFEILSLWGAAIKCDPYIAKDLGTTEDNVNMSYDHGTKTTKWSNKGVTLKREDTGKEFIYSGEDSEGKKLLWSTVIFDNFDNFFKSLNSSRFILKKSKGYWNVYDTSSKKTVLLLVPNMAGLVTVLQPYIVQIDSVARAMIRDGVTLQEEEFCVYNLPKELIVKLLNSII